MSFVLLFMSHINLWSMDIRIVLKLRQASVCSERGILLALRYWLVSALLWQWASVSAAFGSDWGSVLSSLWRWASVSAAFGFDWGSVLSLV